ncbi:MAG: RdgB/HAM1 family non-canonical purine NTP pyrophosphatase [Pyrinomonadaceae bacterium]
MKILLATTNAGKVRELKDLLAHLPFELLSLNNFSVIDVEETGTTFKENSELKASSYSRQTNCWTMADDSGLEVEVLNGAPGVYSARYGGRHASDIENTQKLLTDMSQTPDVKRLAQFVCSVSVADDKGEIQHTTRGVCRGKIAKAPRGNNGFGYDPVFIPEGFDRTFGELSGTVKREISHRSKALKQIITFLSDIPA